MGIGRRCTAEFFATALLLAAVVGSGIMGEKLAGGNAAVALLANSLATGAALVALMLAFDAQMNPLVTLASATPWREVPPLVVAQLAGALAGVAAANAMFELPVFFVSHHARSGPAQLLSEAVATFGLLAVIAGCGARRPGATPYAVAAYVTAAYWFTASTAFANPAASIARAFSDTFSGIRPADVPLFVAAQAVGALAAVALTRRLRPIERPAP